MKWLATAAAALAIAATAWAQSDPSGRAAAAPLPESWRVLPELVARPEEPADGAAVRLEQRRGFGDPAAGCYAVEQSVSVPHKQLDRDGVFRTLGAALTEAGIELGSGDPVPLTSPSVSGAIYSHVSTVPGDRLLLSTLTCFHNQRRPELCEERCRQLAGALERTR